MEENKDLNRIKVMLAEKKRQFFPAIFGHVKQDCRSLKSGLYRTCKN